MKALCLFLAVLFSSVCAADTSNYACLHLQIAIKNNTPNTCYLLTEELTNNSILLPTHDISFKIGPNEEAPPFDIRAESIYGPASIELVYECGEGSYIRLDSQKNPCGNKNTVSTALLYAANLSATAQWNSRANVKLKGKTFQVVPLYSSKVEVILHI